MTEPAGLAAPECSGLAVASVAHHMGLGWDQWSVGYLDAVQVKLGSGAVVAVLVAPAAAVPVAVVSELVAVVD